MDKNQNYNLPPILVAPEYRVWRHLLFNIVGAIITFNQVFITYQDCSNLLGNRIYLICFAFCIFYVVAIYFNYYYLVPRFLFRNRIVIYLLILSAVMFLLPTLSVLAEYWVRNTLDLPHRITSYTNPLILVDNLASSMMLVICFCGVAVVQLFRNWMMGNQHVNRMEYELLRSEVNKLKGQITPGFLSRTLTNASALTRTDPGKTTNMLMQLGQLLRYQLYDCNREKVFLKSEIGFLTSFLNLEQLNNSTFDYRINTAGNFNKVFVAPLLFISFIQDMIHDNTSLDILFRFEGNILLFRCCSGTGTLLSGDQVSLIRKRLELLYPGKYNLSVGNGAVSLHINIPDDGSIS